ncbi:FHA domain-containing protein [Micromonospora sp. NPDC006431]|uniref:FHA domain-containing protein n=1 Tax=Micromonospora sp. NPDC006431 TaxID=3364235 RepID=UPI0036CC01A6
MEEHPELMPLLTVSGGAMRGFSFRVGRDPLVIGRAPTAHIVLADPHLSRRHATVQLTPEGSWLTDLGSTNGTWLNDQRISGSVPLSDGDVVRLGRTDLRYFDPGVARTDPVGMSFGLPAPSHRPTVPLPRPSAPRVPVPREALSLPVDAHS